MDTYMIRQPIMNEKHKLDAYEIIYQQDSSSLYNPQDSKIATAILSFLSHLDKSNFLEGKVAFLTIPPNLLMQNVPHLFDEKKLVIQIEENVLISAEGCQILRRYKNQGFKLALLDFEFNKRYLDILPFVDFMKIDFSNPDDKNIETKINIAHQYNMKTIAYNVDTLAALEKVTQLNFDFFQGNSVAEMVRSKVHKAEHLQSNFFRLIAAISHEHPDFDQIASIISLDVTLTFSLLRVVNSAYFALPNQVKDVKQALTVLGVGQLRHWIYLLSFSSEEGLSEELIKISFLRATFCQELSRSIQNFPLSLSEVYLLGMFSTLDILLKVPMEDAVAELSIDNRVKEALIHKTGVCSDLLDICLAYEQGKWNKVGKLANTLSIPIPVIAQKYFESVEYVNETWKDISQPFQGN
ncbi:EAL and HDOD domain-containing protein [Scatolibacter rhodanostii]|uniref:EAL and HDOD domain-containing protein n=1 Tax=Scatolibacter rhodanostii TaxID=2014781 RepID=UPI000C08266E|nr:HDOD domain-containing protein [Scatolibacter rhodanostii]